jgi:hypothetical protein
MFTIRVAVTIALAFLLLKAQAFGVPTRPEQVVVGDTSARGSFQAASASGDHRQFLTCGLTMELSDAVATQKTSTAGVTLSCSASDASGKFYVCSLQNPSDAWIKMVAHLTETSWIAFSGDAQGHCHGLTVQ